MCSRGAFTARGKSLGGRRQCRRPPSIDLPSLAASLMEDAPTSERTLFKAKAALSRRVFLLGSAPISSDDVSANTARPSPLDASLVLSPVVFHSKLEHSPSLSNLCGLGDSAVHVFVSPHHLQVAHSPFCAHLTVESEAKPL